MNKTIRLTSRTRSDVQLSIDDNTWGALLRKVPLLLFSRDEGEFEVDDADTDTLKEEIGKLAWGRLVRYLASRERSRRECWRYLGRTAIHPTIRNQLLDRAVEYDYLDDARFARLFVAELQRKGKSRRAISSSLRQRGVDEIVAAQTLDEVFRPEEEADAVRIAAQKALRRTVGKPRRERWEKAMASLARKGFAFQDASRAVNEFLEEQ